MKTSWLVALTLALASCGTESPVAPRPEAPRETFAPAAVIMDPVIITAPAVEAPSRSFDAALGELGEVTITSNVSWDAWLQVEWWRSLDGNPEHRFLDYAEAVYVPARATVAARPLCFFWGVYGAVVVGQGWHKWRDYGSIMLPANGRAIGPVCRSPY